MLGLYEGEELGEELGGAELVAEPVSGGAELVAEPVSISFDTMVPFFGFTKTRSSII